MIRIIFACLVFLSPVFAHAEPVYLDCKVSSDKEQKKFSVNLDEDSGKITHTRENGSAFNTEGFFAANTITYQDISIMSGIKITYKYEIGRNDLGVLEVFVVEPSNPEYAMKIPSKTIIMNGACSLVEVEKRKI